LRTAERLGQPQTEQTGFRQRVKHRIRQVARAVERRAVFGNQRRKPRDRFKMLRDPAGRFRQQFLSFLLGAADTLDRNAAAGKRG
jgi:hypothetical protein